jgi:hypothetical protein
MNHHYKTQGESHENETIYRSDFAGCNRRIANIWDDLAGARRRYPESPIRAGGFSKLPR